MIPFSKLRKQAKKQRVEMDARETACATEINQLLKQYNCALEPYLDADHHRIQASARIVALPPKDDKHTNQPAAQPPAGGATTGGEAPTKAPATAQP